MNTTVYMESPNIFQRMADAVKSVPDGWAVSWDIQSFNLGDGLTWFVLIWGSTGPGSEIDIEIIRDNAPDLAVAISEVIAEFEKRKAKG